MHALTTESSFLLQLFLCSCLTSALILMKQFPSTANEGLSYQTAISCIVALSWTKEMVGHQHTLWILIILSLDTVSWIKVDRACQILTYAWSNFLSVIIFLLSCQMFFVRTFYRPSCYEASLFVLLLLLHSHPPPGYIIIAIMIIFF